MYLFQLYLSQHFHRQPLSAPCPLTPCVIQDLGGALRRPGGGRRGPAGLELRLVGESRLRGRRGGRGPSLSSLLEVALVPGGFGEHLHPALLVLLQVSPEFGTLPLALHLPGGAGGSYEDESQRLNYRLKAVNEILPNEALVVATNYDI